MNVTFRKPQGTDDWRTLLDWIAADPEHSAKGMTPEFFYAPDKFSVVIGTEDRPALFVRLDPEHAGTIRLHIQFSPRTVTSSKALLAAWPRFLERTRSAGVSRLIFESASPLLVAFCKRCFGFQHVPGTNDYELILTEGTNNG